MVEVGKDWVGNGGRRGLSGGLLRSFSTPTLPKDPWLPGRGDPTVECFAHDRPGHGALLQGLFDDSPQKRGDLMWSPRASQGVDIGVPSSCSPLPDSTPTPDPNSPRLRPPSPRPSLRRTTTLPTFDPNLARLSPPRMRNASASGLHRTYPKLPQIRTKPTTISPLRIRTPFRYKLSPRQQCAGPSPDSTLPAPNPDHIRIRPEPSASGVGVPFHTHLPAPGVDLPPRPSGSNPRLTVPRPGPEPHPPRTFPAPIRTSSTRSSPGRPGGSVS